MKIGRFVAFTLIIYGCSQEAPKPNRTLPIPIPGPVELKSEQHMRDFLVSGRFSGVHDREDWWEFHEDGTFQAQLVGEKLFGNWSASTTGLDLTKLKTAGTGGLMMDIPDRNLKLDWQDGKLNINIEGKQYRKYQ